MNRRSDTTRGRPCGRLREPCEMQSTDHHRSAEVVVARTSAIVRRIRSGNRQVAGVEIDRADFTSSVCRRRFRAGPFLRTNDRHIGQYDDEETCQQPGKQGASGNLHVGQSNTGVTVRIPDTSRVSSSGITHSYTDKVRSESRSGPPPPGPDDSGMELGTGADVGETGLRSRTRKATAAVCRRFG